MSIQLLLVAVLLPIIGCLVVTRFTRISRKAMYRYVGALTIAVSILVWALILACPEDSYRVLQLSPHLALVLRFDALGRFFAGIVATLWPITVLYASEYMKHEKHLGVFYTFFTMAYGVTLGIAMSGNLFTMYSFYELLTLSTVPLVMHTLTEDAVKAAKTYFAFSLGGAAFAFASMMYLVGNDCTGEFSFGGMIFDAPGGNVNVLLIFYVLGFLGFGVKSAVFPMHFWLPKASVAPTPVTALLHAVAVVKSGAFAVIRLTYYAFGTQLLVGTWAQNTVMCFAVFTIAYGAIKAVKEQHWKRRLAYSTVANLSYILLGISIMSKAGLVGALLHMAFHAEIKILSFFCAGAVLHNTGRQYLHELNGLGRKMPITFACFTVSALALTGIPPFSGFVSKWHLLTAAADSMNPLAYIGAGVLLFAALLTAVYMLTVVCRVWFPAGTHADNSLSSVKEVGWRMTVPFVVLSVGILLTGVFAGPIVSAVSAIVGGLQ